MKNIRLKPGMSLFACVACAFGLLLWARLLLVSSPPRVATAEPPLPEPVCKQSAHEPPVAKDAKDAKTELPMQR